MAGLELQKSTSGLGGGDQEGDTLLAKKSPVITCMPRQGRRPSRHCSVQAPASPLNAVYRHRYLWGVQEYLD